MKNIIYLRKAIDSNPEIAEKLSASMNISKSELSRKLMRPRRLTMGQVMVLKRFFSLSTEETVFIFAPAVAHRNYL